MKISELIYRAARHIEQTGEDCEATIAIEDENGKLREGIKLKCVDMRTDGTAELYGEE